jgi:histidine triad (HIT) family protein
VSGAIPAQIVYSSPDVTAFRDINPQAPTHVLVVPNRHVDNLASLGVADAKMVGQLIDAAREIAQREGVAETGYRLVANVGTDGGQTVPHLHFHLLGGRRLTWPPG